MRLRFIVDLDVDPVSDDISEMLRSEIQSNLESLDVFERKPDGYLNRFDFTIASVHVFEDTTVAPLRESSQAEEFDEIDYEWIYDCPSCGGIGAPLGALGFLQWYRCHDCGIDFNRQSNR